jgi:hypothetical protein
MLRKEKVVAEGNPVNKAKKNAAVSAVGAKNRDDHYLDRMNPDVADKIRGREKLSKKDRQWNMEEVEQIDEISKSLAGKTILQRTRKGQNAEVQGKNKEAEKHYGKMASGVNRFGKKFGANSKEKMSNALDTMSLHYEEVEEIDELSRKTLNSYAYKADKQLTTVNAVGPSHKAGIPGHYRGKNKELGKDPADKMRGRKAGINMAVKKLNKEEVEFSEAEIARLEEIAKSL